MCHRCGLVHMLMQNSFLRQFLGYDAVNWIMLAPTGVALFRKHIHFKMQIFTHLPSSACYPFIYRNCLFDYSNTSILANMETQSNGIWQSFVNQLPMQIVSFLKKPIDLWPTFLQY